MEEKSLTLKVYKKLRRTTHNLKVDLKNKIKDTGYTWTQFHALYHIQKEGIPVNELAHELNCNASNITGLIDRMQEKDLVFREHSREDRRVWKVKLTPAGEKVKNKLLPRHLQNIEENMNHLSQEELQSLYNLLEKLSLNKEEEIT